MYKRQLLHRAVALSEGDTLHLDAAVAGLPDATSPLPTEPAGLTAPALGTPLAEEPSGAAPMPGDLQAYLDAREREILVRALTENRFNRTAAAAQLGISLRQIRYRMARLAIPVPGESEPQDGEEPLNAR